MTMGENVLQGESLQDGVRRKSSMQDVLLQDDARRKKYRAALFISSMTRGGAERVMANLLSWLKGAGWDVTLVTQYRRENEYPVPAGVPRILSELTPEETAGGSLGRLMNLDRRIRKLEKIWDEIRPDLIVAFNGKNNIMAVRSALRGHYPVAVFAVSDPSMEYPTRFEQIASRWAYRRADGVILTTHRCMEQYDAGIRARMTVLPTPLAEPFLAEPEPWPRQHRIVAVGRLDDNKNHAMMMRAFAEAAPEFPDWTFEIYGDGEDREKLTELARKLNQEIVQRETPHHSGTESADSAFEAAAQPAASGTEQRIFLRGRTRDVPAAIRSAAVFLLCSTIEGMPNSLLEAMSLGLAVISTDCPCGGPAEVIRDGENGLLIPVGDEGALTSALRRLLRDETFCERLGRAATGIRSTNAPETAMRAWETYLAGLAEKNGNRAGV